MKLDKQQIESLAHAIVQKSKDARHKEIDVLCKDKKTKALAKKYAAILKQIPMSIRRNVYYLTSGEDNFLKELNKNKKPKTPLLDFTAVKNKIVIASIESDSLEELKRKLKLDF